MKYGFNNLIYNLRNQNSKITLLKQAGDPVTCSTSDLTASISIQKGTYRYIPLYGTSGLSSARQPRLLVLVPFFIRHYIYYLH